MNDTKEKMAVGAFLSAMHEQGLDGAKVRQAMLEFLGVQPAEAKQPLTDDEKSVELYLEQALEYVQMVERNVTTDPRYMAHQAEQRIQSALNLVRLEGFKMAFGEIAKHADLVAKVKKAKAKPLSDEEIGELQDQHLYVNGDDYSIGGQWKFARAIEAAHGIGAKEQ